MIDTHAHLTHPRFAGDLDEILSRARAARVTACVTIGTGVDDGRMARDLARRHPEFVVAAAGLDPFSSHEAGAGFDDALAALASLLGDGGFVAVGEIGLDYHYALDPPATQAERLERQLELARGADLPVVIHVREAHEDMAAVLGAHPACRGVIHSFTSGPREAERYLELGWLLSFNGVLTFKNAEAVREAARIVPPERLLVETDAPYLAPAPHRGTRCEPAFVALTVAALALARGEEEASVVEATTANARRLFGLGSGVAAAEPSR